MPEQQGDMASGLNLDRAYGWKWENTPVAVWDVEGLDECARSGDSIPPVKM